MVCGLLLFLATMIATPVAAVRAVAAIVATTEPCGLSKVGSQWHGADFMSRFVPYHDA
jgi:hypothetical protein